MIAPQSAPHAILLDLNMPGMNGVEVLHWVRKNYSDKAVAVYLMTSSENPEHKKQAAAEGVTGFLSKSPLADKLIEKLDSLIELCNRQGINEPSGEPDLNTTPATMSLTSFSQEQA